MKTILIDGEEYVKKGDAANQKTGNDYYMVRTYSAGVFYGQIKSRFGKEVHLTNARRVYKWAGASTLSQLAMEGTKDAENCKMPMPVDNIILTEAIEIIKITDEALKSLNGVMIWEQ